MCQKKEQAKHLSEPNKASEPASASEYQILAANTLMFRVCGQLLAMFSTVGVAATMLLGGK